MSRLLTHWRLTGRSEAFSAKVRLIDDRVERDDPPHEFSSHGLRFWQLRPSQGQHSGKSARDFVRQGRE